MPSDQFGFTGQEIVTRVQNYVGNFSNTFLTYLTQTLPLAEFRFCKAHDWRFLRKVAIPLTITNGTSQYTLNVASVGYNIAAEDIETIYDDTNGRVLKKIEAKDARRYDPKHADGATNSETIFWFPVNDQTIELYPPTFASGTLKIDAKVTPGALSTLSNYPTIPYKYQESFIEYVTAIMLDKENDDRASIKKQEAAVLIKQDVENDMSTIGWVDGPRLRSFNEAFVDGVGGASPKDFLNWLYRW